MRVLFINPANSPFTEPSLLIEPIDTVVLASYIESLGHETRMIDMDVKQMGIADLPAYLKNFMPEVAVIVFDYHIPLHTTETLLGVLEMSKMLKGKGIKVITGGKLSTYLPHKLLFEDSGVKVTIAHDMELPLKEILEMEEWSEERLFEIKGVAFLKGGEVQKTDKRGEKLDLNALPITNRNLVDLEDYIEVRTILSSRGCFMRCKFCHVPGAWGNWRPQSAEKVVDEIESLVKNYKAKKILFLDDNTTVDKNRMQKISQLILERKIQVRLGCLGTIVSFDAQMMKKMYHAGFRWVHYGVESGDDELLKNIGKLTNAKQVEEVITQTKSIGFRVRTSWIMDLPGTTEKSLEKTIDLILKTQSEEIRLHFLSLRMGSQYYEDYGEKNLTQQYIHNNKSNVQIDHVPYEYIQKRTQELAEKLESIDYTIVRNAAEFRNLEKIRKNNPEMKIVSFCPLRYGIDWEK